MLPPARDLLTLTCRYALRAFQYPRWSFLFFLKFCLERETAGKHFYLFVSLGLYPRGRFVPEKREKIKPPKFSTKH